MRMVLTLACGGLFLGCLAASAQTASLKPLPPAEAAGLVDRIPRALLPPHTSHLEVQKKQVFSLAAPGQMDLLLVPVKFWHGEPSEMVENMLAERDRCGLFVLPKEGKPSFIWTMDDKTGLAVDFCGGMTAMGMMANEGARPRLVAIYRTFSPPRAEDSAAVVLTWDGAKGTYTVDRSAFEYLNDGSNAGIGTVAGAKAALSHWKTDKPATQ
jgi:hypothetical protein